jgi:ribosome-binding protein aMBF1 (putative translation factor)
MGKPTSQNLVGPVIRKIRYQSGLTQAMLTARCNRSGWDIGENTIAKIEAQIRCVTDREIVFLAKALGVKVQDFFSEK